jgi:uncharacterized OB-fold protein
MFNHKVVTSDCPNCGRISFNPAIAIPLDISDPKRALCSHCAFNISSGLFFAYARTRVRAWIERA